MKPIERDMEGQPLPAVDPSKAAKAVEAASKAGKKPRKDRGTRRVSLPAPLLGRIEKHAQDVELPLEKFLDKLLANYEGEDERVTLPPAVLARLEPPAEGSGLSVSELLAEMEGDLVDLLDGRLFAIATLAQGQALPPEAREITGWPIPSLEDRLVEAFRARIRPQQQEAP